MLKRKDLIREGDKWQQRRNRSKIKVRLSENCIKVIPLTVFIKLKSAVHITLSVNICIHSLNESLLPGLSNTTSKN